MKRILCILICLLTFTATAFADKAVIKDNQDIHNLELNYPIITLENAEVSDEINRIIGKQIRFYKKVFGKLNYQYGKVTYDVKHEDNDYLSVVFDFSWYYKNAAHGMYDLNGVVFNKHNGKLVNLKHFVPHLNLDRLIKGVEEGRFPVYNTIFEPYTIMEPWEIERVSHSYFIDEDKNIFLIYQPYELAPYALGNIYIKITPEEAHNLKH